jgi:chromosome segregation protein
MLIRLKSLELHGYKTFADQTRFEFPGAVTAIVGPNGSGKSNIADSLRWVLGEQSYSLLRGKKTDDMIFYGSEQRARASMASATITFDNSDGWLPIDFNEVAVTRRAYRDGQNEYLLNGQRVRLKEISELLAQSGLAERTYTIIGQGLVDTALALKPDERRKLFEEAAGIGLYRSRKEEALHRLDTTRRNLERVQDILAELRPRLSSLERQARKAQEYDQVRADLRMLLRDWYGYHWHRTQKEVKRAQATLAEQETHLIEARRAMGTVGGRITEQRALLQKDRGELNTLYTQGATLNSRLETLNREMAVLDERETSLIIQMKNQESALTQIEEELGGYQLALDTGEQEKSRLLVDLEDARREQSQAQQDFTGKRTERESAEQVLHGLREEHLRIGTDRVKLSARRDELHDRLAALQTSASHLETQMQETAAGLEKLERDRDEIGKQLSTMQAQENKCRADVDKNRANAEECEQHRRDAEAGAAEARNQLTRTQMQVDLLKQAEQSLSGYAEGARRLMQAGREGKLPGVRQTLASLLDVDPEYEAAIAGALGEFIDLVILDSSRQTAKAISVVAEGEDKRAAILPLDWASDNPGFKTTGKSGMLGMAVEFVRCPKEYEPVVRALLGGIPVVKGGEAARAILAGQPASARAVTLGGELYCANGPVLVGKGGRSGLISRSHQIQELVKQVERHTGTLKTGEQLLEKITAELDVFNNQGITLAGQLADSGKALKTVLEQHRTTENSLAAQMQRHEWLKTQSVQIKEQMTTAEAEVGQAGMSLTEMEAKVTDLTRQISLSNQGLAELDLTELESQAAHWDKQVAVAGLAFEEADKRVSERRTALERASSVRQAGMDLLTGLKTGQSEVVTTRTAEQVEHDKLKVEIAELQTRIDAFEASIAGYEKALEELQQSDSSAQQSLTQTERYHTQAQLDLTRQREAIDNLRRRIEDDFGLVAFEFAESVSGQTPLPFDGIVEQLTQVEELPADLEENISRQKGMLRRMGAVNLEAQEEYTAVRERYDFLTAQVEDLHKADADLMAVIAELDELMKKAFQATFSKVAEEFHHTFGRLFPGGHARLALTNEEDVIESGIEIEARLPGRREQGLSLLSGGERSLTACALVFALLKVSPTPFCVLDEVDAMLDEANVNRFSELLAELSAKTQFVVITHNRNTVQVAGVIYGITIGRDSASRVISLKMDEVTEEYVK